MANNLGLDLFPDPVGHFGAPLQPFWILQVVRFFLWYLILILLLLFGKHIAGVVIFVVVFIVFVVDDPET